VRGDDATRCHVTSLGVGIRRMDPSFSLDVNGTTRSTTFMGNGTIPVGGIIMWSGSIASIPAGWALCDGNNGTPNLVNRFVMAAGNTYGVGDVGGASNVTLTVANVPPHRHTSPVFYTNSATGTGGISYYGGSSTTPSQNGNIYNATNTLVTTEGNNPTAVSTLNPYYALAYIMRTA